MVAEEGELVGARHRRDAWQTCGLRRGGRQTGDRCARLSGFGDRRCAGNLETALDKFLGCAAPSYPRVRAIVPKKLASHFGLEELVRVTLGRVEEKLVAVPLARGAGVITTMVHADGLMRIPTLTEGMNAGEEMDIELLRPEEEVESAILARVVTTSPSILEDQLKRGSRN